jgi:hypothetical protein
VSEIRITPQRWRRAAVTGLLCGLFVFLVLLVVVERNATSAYPQTVSGKFMGFDATASAMAFQSDGSTTGTSYAWSAATLWVSVDGATHSGGPITCLQPADRGHEITLGVVTVKPRAILPGTDLIAWVKC